MMRRLDDLQVNGLKMWQDTDTFCFGCDAVELANFAGKSRGKTFCDLGSGNGIISILLAGKFSKQVTAVEIQPKLAQLAQENATLNAPCFGGSMTVVNQSMQEFAQLNAGQCFDVVVCNPPYRKVLSGDCQESEHVALARHEVAVTLQQVAECAAKLLSTGGKFMMIHQCERMAEAFFYLKQVGLEPKVLQVLTPNEVKKPHLFMVECVRGGNEGLQVMRERPIKTYGCE